MEEDESYSRVTVGIDHEINEEIERNVLRLLWNYSTDELIIDFGRILDFAVNLPATKRTVLKVTAQVCDPLGWMSLIIIDIIIPEDMRDER